MMDSMEDKRPTLVTSEHTKKTPLLIIDKKGSLGVTLAEKLQEQFLVVLVSGQVPQLQNNVVHIPFHKKIPVIPDNFYSHMFVFYNGESEILDMLPALSKKANDTKSKLLFITGLSYTSSELFRQLSHHAYQQIHSIVYGEVFAPNGRDHNIVTMFLHQAKKLGRIEIPNDGVGKLYPVLLEDVFSAIIATAFASERRPRLVCVFPRHPVSELSVARMLQKQNPLLRLDFRKYSGRPPHYFVPKEGDYYYSEYPLEEKLRDVIDSFELPTSLEKKPARKKYVFPKPQKRISYKTLWLIITGVLVFPILLTAFVSVSGVAALQLSVREIEKGKISTAKTYAAIGYRSLQAADVVGSSLFYLDPFVRTQKNAVVGQIRVGKNLAATELETLEAIDLLRQVMQGKSSRPKDDFQKAVSTLKNSLIAVQKMRAEGLLPKRVADEITNLEPILVPFANTVDALPAILGFEGKRIYLVLFQNNMELRPGGGFIGSYGLLMLDQGRVKEFSVHDVYDADGKLTVHVEPPYGLRRYLGASHWFLRDSNFAIDFPQNAEQAKTFLQLETGQSVDGVIAVDTSFLQNVLLATGPVTVPDYKEVVTAENFYLRTQTHAEKDFFPGSTQKKDFLKALLRAMQEKIASKEDVNFQIFISRIGESIYQKHVLFAFSDTATQQLFSVNNLSSSLWDARGQGENTYLDFLGVIDANVGINKTNYYLKRTIDQKVTWDKDGKLTTSVTVAYTNTSKKESQFGGDYKNYVRFVLPANVQLQEVVVNGVKQPTIDAIIDPAVFTAEDFSPPKELEIESGQEQGKDSIGFLVLVPTGQTKTVTISYVKSGVIDLKNSVFLYNLRLFKQPGTLEDPYSFSFVYPSSYQVVTADKTLSDVGGKLVYSGVLSEDKEIKAEFARK